MSVIGRGRVQRESARERKHLWGERRGGGGAAGASIVVGESREEKAGRVRGGHF